MKRGSALLIVLGMIAFMVISAVAFSAYMRYSRLPSSYLRRTSASRHLAKAALAEAIDLLDVSIGNDPFPGLGDDAPRGWSYPRASSPGSGETGSIRKRNHWRDHVFIGTNRLMNAEDTVSTLTMEGLAYLPPALINEARFYSRRSSAAVWHTFGFDSGRYAFCAVDVSDHIDINRVFADLGRNSSDRGRITIAHVFENMQHTGSGSPAPSDWDAFLTDFLNVDDIKDGKANAYVNPSKMPFVSLADFNLALNSKQPGWADLMSPFCRYLRSGGSGDFVISVSDQSAELLRSMAFVTDSWFPAGAGAAVSSGGTGGNGQNQGGLIRPDYDLCRAQPFSTMRRGLTDSQISVEDIIPQSTPILQRLKDEMSGIDLISLYDYLDGNDVPTSLALPTTERVPMICGVQPIANMSFLPSMVYEDGFDPSRSPDPTTEPPGTVKTVKHIFKLRLDNPIGEVQTLCMFPFRRDTDADQGNSFTVDCALRIGLVAGGGGPGLRAPDNSAFVIADETDFNKTAVEGGVIKVHVSIPGQPTCKNVTTPESAMSKIGINVPMNDIENWFNGAEIFSVPHKWEVVQIPGTDPAQYEWKERGIDTSRPPEVNAQFHPLNANGVGDGGFTSAALASSAAPVQVTPYMTVAVRVKSGRSNKTVDLVPASVYDDNGFNSVANADAISIGGNANARPLMTVGDQGGGGAQLSFGEASWSGQVPVAFKVNSQGGSLICPDPRWNFAPENFYQTTDQLQGGSWFPQLCGVDQQGRDCDIFMAVSNQGYMQSVAELAMLPRTAYDFGGGDPMVGDCGVSFNRSGFDMFPGASDTFASLAHGRLMWRTYRVFRHGSLAADPIYDLGIGADGDGFRVNPFTSSTRILMAALANTPYSWWAASTNRANNAQLADLGAEDFNRRYAFNEMNSAAKFAWKDLEQVAGTLKNAMRRTDGDWRRGFDDLDWDGENSDLCGVSFTSTDPDELTDVDRKFLYGFWRDSFAAKQQLFLIFLRAEPLMMGGGMIGQTPPQLGARAVALVWRDPTRTQEDAGNSQPRPHRTRILFYRQFD